MQRYFKDKSAVERFFARLPWQQCPLCGKVGTMVRHGYIYGAISPTEYGIRGWRVFCDPDSPRGIGCGHGPGIWLCSTLINRCFTAEQLLLFIFALLAGLSVRAAWRKSGIALSMRSGYRLHKRLGLIQSILRTRLCSRSPPQRKSAGPPLLEALTHFHEAFGSITAYQEELQQDFLATA